MNNYVDLVKDVFYELFHHKLRTLLTLLGMIFGVGAVIAMLSIGEGAEKEALSMIDSMGLRNVIVKAKSMDEQQLKEIREQSVGLSLRDEEVLSRVFPFIEASSSEKNIQTYSIFSQLGKSDAIVSGVSPSYFELSNLNAEQGRLLKEDDNLSYRQVAVIGEQVAKELFPGQQAIGKYIKINHLWVEVVGVLKSKQLKKDEIEGIKLGTEKNKIFLPLKTVLKKFKQELLANELDAIKFQIKPDINIPMAAKAISDELMRRHAEQDDFSITIPTELLKQQQQTRRIFTIVMSCVAGISLLVGGIGIMNIMLATVLERTKEIGLLRAVGARKKDIVIQFVVESFIIAVSGGVIGIFLGYVLAMVISTYAEWAMAMSLFAVVLSVGVCALVGVGFGLFPAIKASRMDPIEALQRE
jgi:putative ABC transport system permease protein